MRIALISTLRTAVPPQRGGSVELVVALMAEELARRGHEVTVFATQDSCISARVLSILPTGYYHDGTVWDWELAEYMQLGLAYEHAREFDLINSHADFYALPFTRLVRTPTVHTFHRMGPQCDFVRFCSMYPEGTYIFLSEFQRRMFAPIRTERVIYNGIDTTGFPFSPQPGSYLVYLGDFRPGKRPLESIRCAQAAGIPIKLAGPESKYFHDVIRPELNGQSVEYVGEVDQSEKSSLLSGALATLFLAGSTHACPLVILESMACGTPVLALAAGPIPELVPQGIGGIHVDGYPALVNAARRVATLDRTAVRRVAVERFDVSRMVDEYLAVFQKICS
jgi:glycosyltransferase involved in cell wall biosynthesis